MSRDALADFIQAARQDAALAADADGALRACGDRSGPEALAAFARDRGYGVTVVDVEAELAAGADDGALADDALDGVSGGATPFDSISAMIKWSR